MPDTSAPMQRPQSTEGAVTPVGVVLLVGIVIAVAALFSVMVMQLRDGNPGTDSLVQSGGRANFGSAGYFVEPTGPEPIPVAGTRIIVTVDGVRHEVPLSAFAAQINGSAWMPGTRLCIVGPGSQCRYHDGQTVGVAVYAQDNFVFEVDALRSQEPPFVIGTGGGTITVNGNRTMRLQIIGASMACGTSSSNAIPVYAAMSVNGGTSYTNLFGGAPVTPSGGQQLTTLVPGGSVIALRGSAIGGPCGFSATFNSVPNNDHVPVLTSGQPAPDAPIFGDQASLESFMQPYVNTQTQTMVLDSNQVIILFEFATLGTASADFQDLVVLLTFT